MLLVFSGAAGAAAVDVVAAVVVIVVLVIPDSVKLVSMTCAYKPNSWLKSKLNCYFKSNPSSSKELLFGKKTMAD